jgi:hypothetical protein
LSLWKTIKALSLGNWYFYKVIKEIALMKSEKIIYSNYNASLKLRVSNSFLICGAKTINN